MRIVIIFFEIKANSSDVFDWMWDSFRFGYLQGLKAAKAGVTKRRRVNER